MGCGGSRADAIIEPRYHESWTRETESTWLTNTDVDTSVPVANSKRCWLVCSHGRQTAGCTTKTSSCQLPVSSSSSSLPLSPLSSPATWCRVKHEVLLFFLMMMMMCLFVQGKALEASLREKRMVNTGTQCGKQAFCSLGSNHQRRPRRSLTDVGVTAGKCAQVWLL